MELQPHQQRVVAEKAELDEKIEKLATFRETPTFAALHVDERHRLETQHDIMTQYSEVLGERIEAFTR